jgi:hypothetical protein
VIGVFCFESTWTNWSDEEMAVELVRLRNLGVTAVATEAVDPPTRLIEAADGADLEAYVAVPCFSAHAWPRLAEGMDLHPVQADGRLRRQMEWYTGLIPTPEGYNRALLGRISAVARAGPAGVILDFIRWPLHWELELRRTTEQPDESSFDARTMAAFARWLRDRDIRPEHGLDPMTMLGPLRERWTEFKCDVITRVACDAAAAVRAIDPRITVGAFIVPTGHEERRRLVGQDVGSMSECLDVLYPMAYHAILQEGGDLVGRVVEDVRARSKAKVIPVVQATADRAVAGPWDWGAEFPASELGAIIDDALSLAPGVVLFPFEGLDQPRRAIVAEALRSRGR